MKKITTKVLYVFSFSLLFTALYLNISQSENKTSFSMPGNKVALSHSVSLENSAVAQPENNTVLK